MSRRSRSRRATTRTATFGFWKHPKPGAAHVIGADPAKGLAKGDPSGACVFERGTGEHVATLHGQLDEHAFAEALVRVAIRYNNAKVAVERENHGHAVIWHFKTLGRTDLLYMHGDGKYGWPENVSTRPLMLDGFAAALRKRTLVTHDRLMLGEMKTFVVTDTGKAEADRGKHDDLVMAGGIGWHVCNASGPPTTKSGGHSAGIPLEDIPAGF